MSNVGNITSSNPGRNGTMFRAPLGAQLPVDAISELAEEFVDQGIVGEDGVSQSINRNVDDVKAYGGDSVYSLQTEFGEEFTVVLYESRNADTLRTVFGDENVSVDGGGNIRVNHNKKKLPRSSFVFDHEIDQGVKRQVMPIGQVASVGDIANTHSDIVRYELTIKAYPDKDGNVLVEYIATDESLDNIQISTAVLAAATQNKAYSAVIVASGGKSPLVFSVVGRLPAGLQLSEDGKLHGTPTGTGDEKITVKVADSEGKSAQKTLDLKISPAA